MDYVFSVVTCQFQMHIPLGKKYINKHFIQAGNINGIQNKDFLLNESFSYLNHFK